MFVTKIKGVRAVVLVITAFAGGAGLLCQAQVADQPKGAQKQGEEKPMPAQPSPKSDKTDREWMVGNWFIINADSLRQGEMWVITEDSILMHAKDGGANTVRYAHRLDASKNPKQIDISVSLVNGSIVGVIKGIYALDGDELRLCHGEMDKDRPAAFPEKPKPGDVLVLRRESSGAVPPAAKDAVPLAVKGDGSSTANGAVQPAANDAQPDQKVLTPEEAIQQRPKEKVTVQFKVTAVEEFLTSGAIKEGSQISRLWVRLKDGNNFSVQLRGRVTYQIERLGINPAKHFNDKVVRVTGRVQHIESAGTFQIVVDDLNQIEVVP